MGCLLRSCLVACMLSRLGGTTREMMVDVVNWNWIARLEKRILGQQEYTGLHQESKGNKCGTGMRRIVEVALILNQSEKHQGRQSPSSPRHMLGFKLLAPTAACLVPSFTP